jgi:hypothetical protein
MQTLLCYSKIVNIKFVPDDAGMCGLVSFKPNSAQKGKNIQTMTGGMEDIPNVP